MWGHVTDGRGGDSGKEDGQVGRETARDHGKIEGARKGVNVHLSDVFVNAVVGRVGLWPKALLTCLPFNGRRGGGGYR